MHNISDKTSLLAVQGPKAILALQKLTDINLSEIPYYSFKKGKFNGVDNVVVSNTGGLSEIIHHEKNGVTVYPGDPDSLACGIIRVLTDKPFSERIAANALRRVKEVYSWRAIAKKTQDFYNDVYSDYSTGSWKPRHGKGEMSI